MTNWDEFTHNMTNRSRIIASSTNNDNWNTWNNERDGELIYPQIQALEAAVRRIEESAPKNVIVKCAYCGGWAAIQTMCIHCGAAV